MSEFHNKVVVVTGAALGLGKVCAIAFAEVGAKVVFNDILEKEGKQTLEQILKSGGEASFIHGDVRDEKHVEALMDFAVKKYGRIDIAINNAGVEKNTPFVEENDDHYNWQMDTNVRGVYYCMKHEIRHMLKTGGGAIVNQASITSNITGNPTEGIYGATKGAVIGMTKSVALEVASKGISINCIAANGIYIPGDMFDRYIILQKVDREQLRQAFPIKRFGRPEELVHTVMFLSSEKARFIVGETIVIDGGFTSL